MRIGPSGARRYYTSSEAPAPTPKISTDIWPMLPPFFTGAQNVPNFGPNFDPSRLRTAVFLNWALFRKTKTNLSRTDDRSTTTPNLGWLGPPNSQNRWRIWYPKGWKWKISYISSIPAAQAEYSATNVIPSAVKRLPCHICQFAPYISQGGGKN